LAHTRLNDWNLRPDPVTLDYHLRQQREPKRSTVHFEQFCAARLKTSNLVVDAGCGAGGPTAYLATAHPHCNFLGIDESEALIAAAPAAENLRFAVADLHELDAVAGVDGVTLIQVLSWLEDYQAPLAQVCASLQPDWIAFSTLIYEGNIDCQIVVSEIFRPRRSFYNIYALPRINAFMQEDCGYRLVAAEPFVIDIDLEKPADPDLMGTYTVKLQSGSRLQCSGPLQLPWHFVMYEKIP